MKIDEKRVNTLAMKVLGSMIETDHNPVSLEINLKFSPVKQERIGGGEFEGAVCDGP